MTEYNIPAQTAAPSDKTGKTLSDRPTTEADSIPLAAMPAEAASTLPTQPTPEADETTNPIIIKVSVNKATKPCALSANKPDNQFQPVPPQPEPSRPRISQIKKQRHTRRQKSSSARTLLADCKQARQAKLAEKTALAAIKSPALPPVKYYRQPTGQAFHLAEAVVGIAHRKHNAQPRLPCQDAAHSTLAPRPILIVCDGAGSSAMSDIGSQALCIGLTRLCQSLEPLLIDYLDQPAAIQLKQVSDTQPATMRLLVRIIIRQAIGLLQDLASEHRRSIRDFRSTLNLAIIGKHQALWLRVGDGEIITEQQYRHGEDQDWSCEYHCLGEPSKGDFANQTQFVDDSLTLTQVHWGCLDSTYLTGLALMSDGSSEKLVSHQRDRIAGRLTQWLELLRQDKLSISELYQTFYSPAFLTHSTGDDRSIALYSRAD